jgi:hypothetical protein
LKQNKYKKPIIFAIVISTLLFITMINSVAAKPLVTYDPTQPEALSTIKFTAEIDEVDATNVELVIQECTANLCYTKVYVAMTKIDDNTYEKSYTLTRSKAIYLQYWIEVETDQGTTSYGDYTNITYKESTNGETNGNGNTNDTPGFELAGLILSVIFISVIFYRRKR